MALNTTKTATRKAGATKAGGKTTSKRASTKNATTGQQPSPAFQKWQGTGNRYGFFDMHKQLGTTGQGGQTGNKNRSG